MTDLLQVLVDDVRELRKDVTEIKEKLAEGVGAKEARHRFGEAARWGSGLIMGLVGSALYHFTAGGQH